MKQAILTTLLFAALSGAAQTTPEARGYWVVENNIHAPKESVVLFYAPDHQLMYKETVSGKKIKIQRSRVQKKLNAVLDEVTLAWKRDAEMKEKKALVKL